MKIKFDSVDADLLSEFEEFIYNIHPELEVEEIHSMTPGVLKEPVVVAIIAAIGTSGLFKVVRDCYIRFLEYKEKQLAEESKLKNVELAFKKDAIKISLDKGQGWKYEDQDSYIKMETDKTND